MANFSFSRLERPNCNLSKDQVFGELNGKAVLIETVAAALPEDRGIPKDLKKFWDAVFSLSDLFPNSKTQLLIPDLTVRQLRRHDSSSGPGKHATEFEKQFLKQAKNRNTNVCFDNQIGLGIAKKIAIEQRQFLLWSDRPTTIHKTLPRDSKYADETLIYLAHHFVTYGLSGAGYDNRMASETRILAVPPTERIFLEMIASADFFQPNITGEIFIALFTDFSKNKPPYRS